MLVTLLDRVTEVIDSSGDVRQAARATLRVVCEVLGWPVGHLYVPDKATGEFVSAGVWEGAVEQFPALRRASARLRFAPGVGGVGRAVRSGEPVWLHDLRHHPDFVQAGEDERGEAGTVLEVPLVSSTGVAGVLEFFTREVIPPDEVLLRVMDTLGRNLGQMLDRRRTQQHLDRARHRLDQLVETSADALVSVDADGRIISWNTAAEQMFGIPRHHALGRSVHETISPEHQRATDIARREQVLASGTSDVPGQWLEQTAVRADGTEFPIELMVWPALENDAWTFHLAIHDITDRRRAERALREAYRQQQATVARLEELDRAKDEFIANVSHELRTPLTSILGNLEVVLDPDDPPPPQQRDRMLRAIDHNAQRLRRLVEDLLSVHTTAERPLIPQRAPVPVTGLLNEAAEQAAASTAGDHPIDIRVDPDVTTVDADRALLLRALGALISNAAKFSPRHTTITLHAGSTPATGPAGPGVAIAVTDRGIGILAEELPHLFDRFSRARTTTDQAVQGIGLGLTIARTIAEAHNGALTAISTPGKGTTFILTLPAETAPPS
ncbi:sensor histidine kinase [Spirillospora albida]|uniref:sensor histidine kinase n=1 Tax=Spirillospora albida TaxID=58123 RepID=UPI0004BF92F2|nr:ATP-binding protein [Spirillospora albida]